MARQAREKASTSSKGDGNAPDMVTPEEDATQVAENGAVEDVPDYEALYQAANEKWLRSKAEFENYRRRVQREFADIRTQTKMLTVQEFLSVYDHFQMAAEHAAQNSDVDSLRQGIELIQGEFARTLEALGAVTFEALGKPFDPELHEAIAQEASPDVPDGHVMRQWKAGFMLGDRLLRPATVVVSSGDGE